MHKDVIYINTPQTSGVSKFTNRKINPMRTKDEVRFLHIKKKRTAQQRIISSHLKITHFLQIFLYLISCIYIYVFTLDLLHCYPTYSSMLTNLVPF
jgi:hypothetical protein